MDVIIRTENLINAVQNEPSIWNTELNASEEEKELALTRIAGVLQHSKSRKPQPYTCTAQVRSMGFMHATHEQVFGLASMVDFGHTTRHARSRKSETS